MKNRARGSRLGGDCPVLRLRAALTQFPWGPGDTWHQVRGGEGYLTPACSSFFCTPNS